MTPAMTAMRKYESYKDSGIDWIGRIPENWEVKPLKTTVKRCTNGVWGEDPKESDNTIVIRVADFDRDKLRISDNNLTFRHISQKDIEICSLKKGDLLIEKSGGGDKTLVGRTVLFDKEYKAVTSNFIAKITPYESCDPIFLNYVFACLHSNNVNYISIKQTTGIQNLNVDSYLHEEFPFPEPQEQTTIAKFLDEKTTQIDEAIRIKKKQIVLLKEHKQIIIQNAVTKGLNPNAPMKDSGVEWLEDIPSHWKVAKLTHHLKYDVAGFTPESGNSTYYGEGYDWANISDLNENYLTSTKKQLTPAAIKRFKPSIAPKGCLLFSFKLSVGAVSIATKDLYTNEAIAAFHPSPNVITKYLFYMAPVSIIHNSEKNIYGARILNQERINSAKIIVPPIKEQEAIVAFLDEKTERIDEAAKLQQAQINKLKEYKASLINSAVTGKIKVS